MIPRPYQIAGRDFLASRRHALLADGMRVGKTPQAILAAKAIGARRVLVVGPAIAVEHWKREWVKWWPAEDSIPFNMVVISYDRLRRNSVEYLSQRYDLAIVDECHFAKNPEAQRTQLIFGRGGLGWCSDRVWCLSGTPATKHAGELYPMMKAFGVTNLSYSAFTRRYCSFAWDGSIKGTNPYRIPELKALLATFMLRRTRAEIAPDMPKIGFEFLEVTPFEQVDLQLPSGANYEDLKESDVDKEDRIAVAKAKALPLVEEIAEAIESGNLKQTVVFGWHTEPLEAVWQGLRARGINAHLITGATTSAVRERIQDSFRQGVCQVVVANILAAGTAIDLSAASHGYFLELDWLSVNNMQAANRLVSMQKAEPVTFDICTMPGTVDDRVQRVLMRRVNELNRLY